MALIDTPIDRSAMFYSKLFWPIFMWKTVGALTGIDAALDPLVSITKPARITKQLNNCC